MARSKKQNYPKLAATVINRQAAAELSEHKLPASGGRPAVPANSAVNNAKAAGTKTAQSVSPLSCEQRIKLSIFFDGTGNNLKADVGDNGHSNVARLYRAHPVDDEKNNTYRLYVPGLGTYFPEKGDDGSAWGGRSGLYGQERMDYAFEQLNDIIISAKKRAQSANAKIVSIQVNLFGFSRGAALARAWMHTLATEKCHGDATKGYTLKAGGYPIEVGFLGLFDTVASVGVAAAQGGYFRNNFWVNDNSDRDKVLKELAFGPMGSTPSSGSANGHQSWGANMRLQPIYQQGLHLIAGHEWRNSFPVDSVISKGQPAPNMPEIVHAGAHSDVGGGYETREGGRGLSGGGQIGLVSLWQMYDAARQFGVPFLLTNQFGDENKTDFGIDPANAGNFKTMVGLYTNYMRIVGSGPNIGADLLAHAGMHFRWRFSTIRARLANPGKTAQQQTITKNEAEFKKERDAIDKEIKDKEASYNRAQNKEALARDKRTNALRMGLTRPELLVEVEQAKARVAIEKNALMEAKAKRTTKADDSKLLAVTEQYDKQLLSDARSIEAMQKNEPNLRLRPHYRRLLHAYQHEFVEARGALDPQVAELFNLYVHDSLAGFDHDGTRPSDPRIVFVGGEVRLGT